jgi:prophage regulatory protein
MPAKNAAQPSPALVIHIDSLAPGAFLRLPAVMAVCGLKRSTIYDQINLGRFPSPLKLTAHAAGWRVGDIRAWLDSPTAWRPSPRVVA